MFPEHLVMEGLLGGDLPVLKDLRLRPGARVDSLQAVANQALERRLLRRTRRREALRMKWKATPALQLGQEEVLVILREGQRRSEHSLPASGFPLNSLLSLCNFDLLFRLMLFTCLLFIGTFFSTFFTLHLSIGFVFSARMYLLAFDRHPRE